jgi:hypothetical protein
MGIKLGDQSLQILYLQEFLKENYSSLVIPTGVYDSNTHSALKKYMSVPETIDQMSMIDNLKSNFGELFTKCSMTMGYDSLTFTSSKDVYDYLYEIRNDLRNYLNECRWVIKQYDILDNPLTIVIKSNNNISLFPKKDLMCMVNLFENKFLYNKAIRDGIGLDDFVHTNSSGTYKISVISCSPNCNYTISHSGNKVTTVVVGSSRTQSTDISSLKLDNVQSYSIDSGKCAIYKTVSPANYLVVQVSAIDSDTSINISKILILEGDHSGSSENIPFSNFSSDSWLLGDKFMSYVLGASINPRSSHEDINYVQKIIEYLDPEYAKIASPGVYDSTLISLIRKIQNDNNITFSLGYVDPSTEAYLLSEVNGSDLNLYE